MVREDGKRTFALLNEDGIEIGIYAGKYPRQAALKVANDGITNIRLRERNGKRLVKKIHIFEGSRTQIPKPAGAPDWMPEMIWKPNVKKVRIEKIVINSEQGE